ncbi:hypothetical protein [Nocardia vaccinii]|uniref:hypothetical protein n=1 Tax=Nocardia vaccinii TaxID=1822 RepID=UPI00082ABD30|nr:hypothetical protein [Nocardia vaccinii]
MALPQIVADLNRILFNPVFRTFSWAVPPYAIVVVRQCETAEVYPVPVQAYGTDAGKAVIAMTYGHQRNWVQNVLAAGGAQIWHGGTGHLYVNPRLVDVSEGYRWIPDLVTAPYKAFGTRYCLMLDSDDAVPVAHTDAAALLR